MSETIVVAVDGRPAGDRALRWAARRAAGRDAEITVTQAVDVPGPPIGTREHAAAIERVAERIGDAALATLLEAGVTTARSVIERGDVVDVIEHASQGADLVVIGTNGSSGPFSPATRAVRVAAVATPPVVIVPDLDADHRHGVVVGLDGSAASLRALQFGAAEAVRSGEPLIALSTWRLPGYLGYEQAWPTDLRDALAEAAEQQSATEVAGLSETYPDLVVERRVFEGAPTDVLVEVSAEAALVVVGSRGLGRVRRLLLGSVSQAVVQHARGPVAVVR